MIESFSEAIQRNAVPIQESRNHARASDRIVIDNVQPSIAGGRYPAKAIVGDLYDVEADILSDGHGKLAARVLYLGPGSDDWRESALHPLGNDRWAGKFQIDRRGIYRYRVEAWRDTFETWRTDAEARLLAGQSLAVEMKIAQEFITQAAAHSSDGELRDQLQGLQRSLVGLRDAEFLDKLSATSTTALFRAAAKRSEATLSTPILQVVAEREAAAFSAWYELTPRSQSGDAGRHGTFDDVIARLPYVRDMGFDVLYLTPIHPIGITNRKGRNNSLKAGPGDPGSPYAIGSADGGHDAVHPELGTFEDFDRLIEEASRHGLEIALDFAIQCSPDHPWIREHPEWFAWLPDGSIRFAENPPKKYEDIVNVEFYGPAYPGVWHALRDVVLFWVAKGVKIFRVDNPHTKPLPFWEWLIREVQTKDPDVIFLSEAFTRPKIMAQLAKLGFTQSYSYFTWRNTKAELTDYLTELTRGPSRHFMRPNFFTNTPDINPTYLQTSGRAGFQARLVLAATLGGNYGIYSGFELCEATPIPGKEEYLDSEKYEIKVWDWDRPGNIREDITRMNALRRASAALQRFDSVRFYNAWNDSIIYYGKASADLTDFILVAVNLDPHNAQEADFEVPLWELGLADDASIDAVDLVTERRFTWDGKRQHLRLDPAERAYAIWRLIAPERAS